MFSLVRRCIFIVSYLSSLCCLPCDDWYIVCVVAPVCYKALVFVFVLVVYVC